MTCLGRSIFSLSLIVLLSLADITRYETCYLRCIAGCTQNGTSMESCQTKCEPYEAVNFCAPDDAACWSVCRDLGQVKRLSPPQTVHVEYSNGTRTIEWHDVPGASLYATQYRTAGGQFDEDKSMLSTTSSLKNVQLPGGRFCDPFAVRVAAFSQTGVSNFSADTNVESPKPSVAPSLKLVSIQYSNDPLVTEFYNANGTLIVTFEFDDQHWPLGVNDLTVIPMFNLINCQVPDYSQTVPMAEFVSTTIPRQLMTRLGADQMYRRCRYVYYTQSATSNQCKTETSYYSPPVDALRTLDINCTTVHNSPCLTVAAPPAPICGQIANSSITPYTSAEAIRAEPSAPIAVNLSFTPHVRSNEPPTLYYVAIYGDAIAYDTPEQEAFQGVNQTDVIGTVSSCADRRFPCQAFDSADYFLIDNIYLDKMYGVTICAIKSNENLNLPTFPGVNKSSVPKSIKMFIEQKPYLTDNAPLIVGLSVGSAVLLCIVLTVVCGCYRWKKMKRNMEKKYKLNSTHMNHGNNYIPFPKMQDIWEIDRRNVDVYTSKKLGSGAFGAVYLGKLIGRAHAHHDSNSPLGVNLMRAENCEVAIKTLPESADEESKQEFLREISLMKSIGFHERLVNMLACVTESEPFLLVVEFCSDGDLLQFLRKRCKYMIKLGEHGINISEPKPEDDIDISQIMTMKQLLMYAVQTSYGLEYLSQKGFVHRDVAARNILVHEGTACKIGDFGLCRRMGKDEDTYKSRGGRLPLKWMSPEAIRDYEFSTKSDVWAFGVLMFEIITLGGCPYPEWRAGEVLPKLERGERMEKPDNCSDEIYSLMKSCWYGDQSLRPDFSMLRQRLAALLEEVTEEYSYLKLDSTQNYYNVHYEDDGRVDVAEMPAPLPRKRPLQDPDGVANPAFAVEMESET